MIKFINLSDLDNPIHIQPLQDIFSRHPFYQDTYMTILMKVIWKPTPYIKPCILNDKHLMISFGVNELENFVKIQYHSKEVIYNPTFKWKFEIYQLLNGWWCMYFEKQYIWDGFINKCVCTTFSQDKDSLHTFFYMCEDLIKPPKSKKNCKELANRIEGLLFDIHRDNGKHTSIL